MQYIGVDIGSSFIKGAVLDVARIDIQHVSRRPFPEPIAGLPSLHFEIDPRAVVAAVEELLAELLPSVPDCLGVLFTGQMGGVILLDEKGRPLTNYLSWRDERTTNRNPAESGSYLESAAKRLGNDGLQRIGNELRAGSPAALLFWLAERGKLPSGATPVSLGDFVVSQMCRSQPVTEFSQALGTLDLATLDFCRPLQEELGLTGLAWPKLRTVWQPAGIWRVGGREIPCYPVVGDHQCALSGTLLAEGELSINVSTGSQISLLTGELTLGEYQTRPYIGGKFLNTITHLPAGRSLEVLVSLLSELADAEGVRLNSVWPSILRAASQATDSDLAVDLAFFAGSLGSRGSISNISTENLTLGRLFRAAFHSMAENYATCAERLSPERNWRRIVFSGGLAQHLDILRQFIVERIGGEVRLSANTEDTLLGLLVLGLVISGKARDLEEASGIVRMSFTEPDGRQ